VEREQRVQTDGTSTLRSWEKKELANSYEEKPWEQLATGRPSLGAARVEGDLRQRE
jgi:hypothetical protein